jgi:hypothetical protein
MNDRRVGKLGHMFITNDRRVGKLGHMFIGRGILQKVKAQ